MDECCLSAQAEVEVLKGLFDKYVECTLDFKKNNCNDLIPITELNGVTSLCCLYDSLATPANGVSTVNHPRSIGGHTERKNRTKNPRRFVQVNLSDTANLDEIVGLWFVFSLIWSICASVDENGRKLMNNFLREKEDTFPVKVLRGTRVG